MALKEESFSATDFQSTPLARKVSSVPYPKATSGDVVRLFVVSILHPWNRERYFEHEYYRDFKSRGGIIDLLMRPAAQRQLMIVEPLYLVTRYLGTVAKRPALCGESAAVQSGPFPLNPIVR